MPDFAVVWNLILTALVAAVAFFVKGKFTEMDDLSKLLTQTREEIARDKATREELSRLSIRMEAGFIRLEDKIDKVVGLGGK